MVSSQCYLPFVTILRKFLLPGTCSAALYMRYFLFQDVVWEKLDAIDGNTVYVGSQIHPPGELGCCKSCYGSMNRV